MLKRTTLMLMAATLAPLPLFAESAPTAQGLEALAAQAEETSTPQKRAEVFPAAALLPADVEMAVVIPQLAATARNFSADAAEQIGMIGDVAVGLGDGSDKSLMALQAARIMLGLGSAAHDCADSWNEVSKDSLKELITQAFAEIGNKGIAGGAAALEQVAIHPIYVAISPAPGQEDALKAMVEQRIEALAEMVDEEAGVTIVDINGMKGLKVNGKAISASFDAEYAGTEQKVIADEISKRTFYVLIGMNGNAATLAICEQPEAVHFAGKPEDSVLSTTPWIASDAHLADTIYFAASATPEMSNAQNDVSSLSDSLLDICTLFKDMAERDAENAATYQAAAVGLETILKQLPTLSQPDTKPSFVMAWGTPGHIHISVQGDAKGFSYKPGQLKLAAMADEPENILYVECTGAECKCSGTLAGLLPAATDVARGFMATLTPEDQAETAEAMGAVEMFMPEIQQAGKALATVGEGLGGSSAIVIDCAGQVPPYMATKQAAALPRLAVHSGVKERAKLAQGWNDVMATVGKVMTKIGQDPALLTFALPIVPATVDNVTTYTVAQPFFTPDMGVSVSVSDTDWVIGTSGNLNAQIAKSATGTVAFAGSAFSLNLSTLAKAVRTIADMTGSTSPTDACDGDDCCEPMNAGSPAADMADALESAAMLIDKVQGTSTVSDGLHTLHIDVQLKQD